jgi:hypothetical protein
MPDYDLRPIRDSLLAGALERAQVAAARCEPLSWKSEEGLQVWLGTVAIVRRLEAELSRRIASELEDL